MRLDVFDCFRWILATIATVYATVVTVQSAMGWYAWLRGNDKYVSLARRYLIVHGLRLRVRTFGGDVLVCALLCATFLILWYAHGRVEAIGETLRDLRHAPPHVIQRSRGAEAKDDAMLSGPSAPRPLFPTSANNR